MPTNTRDDEAAGALPSLWTCRNDRPPRHPAGHSYRVEYQAGASCGTCVWGYPFRGELRCRHAPAIRLAQETPACARWEPVETLDCQDCGACCREAYHSVELGPRDRVIRRHPALVIHCETHRKLRREGNRCAALLGGETPMDTYRCDIYPDRPGSCRDFARGGAHCLDARRRVGLSL